MTVPNEQQLGTKEAVTHFLLILAMGFFLAAKDENFVIRYRQVLNLNDNSGFLDGKEEKE